MFKTSILRAKIKRSNTNFKKTLLWDDVEINYSNSNSLVQLFLDEQEEIIMHYVKSKKYKWILTSKRLIFPNYFKQFFLSDLIDVDFPNIKESPEKKVSNNELTLSTNNESFRIFIEEGTWHLFFEVFKFIINNKDTPAGS